MCVWAQSFPTIVTPWAIVLQVPLFMEFSGVGCHFLLYGIFQIQGLNSHLLHLLHRQVDSLPLSHHSLQKYCLSYHSFAHFGQDLTLQHDKFFSQQEEISELSSSQCVNPWFQTYSLVFQNYARKDGSIDKLSLIFK